MRGWEGSQLGAVVMAEVSKCLPVGQPNSFDPLPNPRVTQPSRWTGNGASGLSGPTISDRSTEGSWGIGGGRVESDMDAG